MNLCKSAILFVFITFFAALSASNASSKDYVDLLRESNASYPFCLLEIVRGPRRLAECLYTLTNNEDRVAAKQGDDLQKIEADMSVKAGKVGAPIPSEIRTNALSATQLYRLVDKSVYVVYSANNLQDLRTFDYDSQGSAVAISTTNALTNCHVVEAKYVAIAKAEDIMYAKVISRMPDADRCVLEIDEGALRPISGIRRYNDLKVGEQVYTVGSPSGLENTIGEGLLSGLRYDDDNRYIQTSAPISPGSSGGGLFDSMGNLLGITTLYFEGSQNLNFAIPAQDFWK
jgi:S1-C subfamily serine protease